MSLLKVLIQQGGNWDYKTYDGVVYYGNSDYYGSNYYVSAADTAVLDNTGTVSVDGAVCRGQALALVAEVDGYQYSTLAGAGLPGTARQKNTVARSMRW